MSVTSDDITAAAARIGGHVLRTPLLRSPRLDERVGGTVLLKAECLQITGSFKLRGATNAVLSLPKDASSVVAYSSGNHAQAVAYAAREAGLPAIIVMPADAPTAKRERTRGYGAEVILYDRRTESREEIGAEIARLRGAVLIPPYDHPATIAGQGTVGLEIAEEAGALGLVPDQLLACCSGGGLAAGAGTALQEAFPDCEIVTVEPDGFDDTARSLAEGYRIQNDAAAPSVCDALLIARPGELTFPLLQALRAEGRSVSDREAMAAVAYAADELRVVLEPGGAAALAAVLFGRVRTADRVTAVTLSGGNLDMQTLCTALGTTS